MQHCLVKSGKRMPIKQHPFTYCTNMGFVIFIEFHPRAFASARCMEMSTSSQSRIKFMKLWPHLVCIRSIRSPQSSNWPASCLWTLRSAHHSKDFAATSHVLALPRNVIVLWPFLMLSFVRAANARHPIDLLHACEWGERFFYCNRQCPDNDNRRKKLEANFRNGIKRQKRIKLVEFSGPKSILLCS